MKMIISKKRGGLLSAMVISMSCLNTFASEDENLFENETALYEIDKKQWEKDNPRDALYRKTIGGYGLTGEEIFSMGEKMIEEERARRRKEEYEAWKASMSGEEQMRFAAQKKRNEDKKQWKKDNPREALFLKTIGKGGWTMEKLNAMEKRMDIEEDEVQEKIQPLEVGNEGSESSGW
jgi:hypothetical protein